MCSPQFDTRLAQAFSGDDVSPSPLQSLFQSPPSRSTWTRNADLPSCRRRRRRAVACTCVGWHASGSGSGPCVARVGLPEKGVHVGADRFATSAKKVADRGQISIGVNLDSAVAAVTRPASTPGLRGLQSVPRGASIVTLRLPSEVRSTSHPVFARTPIATSGNQPPA